jgi:proline iminopeptidase
LYRSPPLLDLFPPISPYSSGFIAVDGVHTLYWEQSGNPEGIPVLYLHGGPGGGASPRARQFFDPDHYRIIIFDQRGAGRSTPVGSVENNTLPHLLDDIEKIRLHLSIERWHIFGGSWGSTLAIAYAEKNPQRCISMILYGIFLMEQPEIDWFLYGIKSIFPEAWEQFAAVIPEEQRYDLLEGYYEFLTTGPIERRVDTAINWTLYESACVSLLPNFETITTEEQKTNALAMAAIEAHYFRNNVISTDQSLLNHIDRLRSIPSTIIHGRYDIMCPIVTAHKLHQLWPEADYVIVPNAGHSSHEPGIRSRLIEATEHAKTII